MFSSVISSSYDFSFVDDNAANRRLIQIICLLRLKNRLTHIFFIDLFLNLSLICDSFLVQNSHNIPSMLCSFSL